MLHRCDIVVIQESHASNRRYLAAQRWARRRGLIIYRLETRRGRLGGLIFVKDKLLSSHYIRRSVLIPKFIHSLTISEKLWDGSEGRCMGSVTNIFFLQVYLPEDGANPIYWEEISRTFFWWFREG